MDIQTDLKGYVKARVGFYLQSTDRRTNGHATQSEFIRRLEQSSPSIVGTMTAFLRRSSPYILNQSSVSTLIKRVAKGGDPPPSVGHSQTQQDQSFSDFAAGSEPEGRAQKMALAAQQWMTYVSKHCPSLYKAHLGEISKAIADDRNARLVEVCLHALAAVAMWDRKLAPSDKRTIERVLRFAMESNERHAKFAIRLIMCMKNAEVMCDQVVEVTILLLHPPELNSLTALIGHLGESPRN